MPKRRKGGLRSETKPSVQARSGGRKVSKGYAQRRRAALRRKMNRRTEGLLAIEKKFLDYAVVDVTVAAPADCSGGEIDPTTSSILCLNACAQGDGWNRRDGRQIVMESIFIRGVCAFDGMTGATTIPEQAPLVFIALVLDKQTNGAQLNSEDVFWNWLGDAGLAALPQRNPNGTQRYRVLKEWTLSFAGKLTANFDGTYANTGGGQISWGCWLDLGAILVDFGASETTATISAIENNSLHLIAYRGPTSGTVKISYASRIRFKG